jgi:hypothetical protein
MLDFNYSPKNKHTNLVLRAAVNFFHYQIDEIKKKETTKSIDLNNITTETQSTYQNLRTIPMLRTHLKLLTQYCLATEGEQEHHSMIICKNISHSNSKLACVSHWLL